MIWIIFLWLMSGLGLLFSISALYTGEPDGIGETIATVLAAIIMTVIFIPLTVLIVKIV